MIFSYFFRARTGSQCNNSNSNDRDKQKKESPPISYQKFLLETTKNEKLGVGESGRGGENCRTWGKRGLSSQLALRRQQTIFAQNIFEE